MYWWFPKCSAILGNAVNSCRKGRILLQHWIRKQLIYFAQHAALTYPGRLKQHMLEGKEQELKREREERKRKEQEWLTEREELKEEVKRLRASLGQ